MKKTALLKNKAVFLWIPARVFSQILIFTFICKKKLYLIGRKPI
jgi:hypothetical protein